MMQQELPAAAHFVHYSVSAIRSHHPILRSWDDMPAKFAAATLIIDRLGRRDVAEEFLDCLDRHQRAHPDVELLPGVITAQATKICSDPDRGKCPLASADWRAKGAFQKHERLLQRPEVPPERRRYIAENLARLQLDPDKAMHKGLQDEYGSSRDYSITRLAELHASRWTCRRCGALLVEGAGTHIHHVYYGRPFHERLGSDIQAICDNCHRQRHG